MEAKERQGTRTDLTSGSIEPEVEFGRSSEIAAEKFNESKFCSLYEPVKCHPVWARHYVSITQNEILSNGHHSVVLPRDINILYELSRIDESGLKIAFAEGWIKLYIKRKDIKDKRAVTIIKEGAVKLA